MAAILGRVSRQGILKSCTSLQNQQAGYVSFKNLSRGKKAAVALCGALAVGGAGVAVAMSQAVLASDLILHPPKYPWSHKGHLNSLDHAAVRRGYKVYKEVCAACHSMRYLHYRQMVGVFFSEAEAKAEAADAQIIDGPDEEGNMFKRPGKLADAWPNPYRNDEEARFANNGALPPDLSLVILARHGTEDYIFSLLTGYCDAPAGIDLGEGQVYNPYFPGGSLSMVQALFNDMLEYEDGTPATQSQLAKDVVTFLRWSCDPEHDDRKRMGLKVLTLLGSLFLFSYYLKRHKWAGLKSRKILFVKPR